MSRRIMLVALGLMLMALAGCGAKGMSVTIDGEKSAVAGTTSIAMIRPDMRELQILVANYNVDMAGHQIMDSPQATKAGEIKVVFHVKGDGKDFKNPVEPGEYDGSKITTAYVSKGGSDNDFNFKDSGKPVDGKVVIDSMEGGVVKGSVNIKHGDRVIEGSFAATLRPVE